MLAAAVPCVLALLAAPTGGDGLSDVVVERDDVVVTRSCRLVVPEGRVVEDADGDGVVHVRAHGVRVVFAPGAVLRGAPRGTAPDALAGTGIRVDGWRDVVVEGARIEGFAVGLHATRADGLRVRGARVAHGLRQRLRSTPEAADDGADWLDPHDNEDGRWRRRYGAALCVEDARGVEVSGCRAREVQNGLILDRVEDARVFDNDFSFLSGWGVAMWRSGGNVLDHNALDFCVRGYSHGVYNRGQDSAGLLMFEQCSDNVVAHNSITHGGDGVFAFAGREALGERGAADLDREGLGDDRNAFLANDLSYAAAHGLELTFSFDNVVADNRVAGNAICGVWGGYSRRTVIADNRFVANGDAGYGLERGGVNVEHGAGNVIVGNVFEDNACDVHLWWDEDEAIARLPWARANGVASRDELVVANVLSAPVAVQLRATEGAVVAGNTRPPGARVFVEPGDVAPGRRPVVGGEPATEVLATVDAACARVEAARHAAREVVSGSRPVVGARARLAGREHIVMTEWGPWDHASPLLRRVATDPGRHVWELAGVPPDVPVVLEGEGLALEREGDRVTIAAGDGARGLFPYRVACPGLEVPLEARGAVAALRWEVVSFATPRDPREDPEAFARRAAAPSAGTATLPRLHLPYGTGGPGALAALEDAWRDGTDPPPADHFGTRARTRVPLRPGAWRITTVSDDGIRVRVDGETVIDDWTHHAPRARDAVVTLDAPREVEILVEHFELDGYAWLSVGIEPVSPEAPRARR